MKSDLLNNYLNKWVLLSSDRKSVLAYSDSLKDLSTKFKKIKVDDAIFHFVLPNNRSYSP